MTIYDTANITNSTNVVMFVERANDLSGGILVGGILAGLFVIFFISMKSYDTGDAFGLSSFIVMIISLLLYFGGTGWITSGVLYFWVAVFALNAIISLIGRYF